MPTTEPAWLAMWPGVLRDESLAKHSQYGVGGPADWFIQLDSASALGDLRRHCHHDNLPLTVLGAGSNALILDGGVRGVVVQMRDRAIQILDDTTVALSAGYMMPRAALDLAKRGIAGLEFGIGVPGSCGASVYGNAGAFGTEIKDVLIDCDAIAPDGSLDTLTNTQCEFAYRDSVFKHELSGHIVAAARFQVRRDDAASVRARTDAIQSQRKASQPYGIRSLGSVFKNPPGDHAGRLVEAAGLKGMRSGGAQISEKHANFIVNADNATATDVLALVSRAHETVLQKFGVDLETEIVLVGEGEV